MNEMKSFWTTLPGILTGLAALIAAIGSLLVMLNNPDEITPEINSKEQYKSSSVGKQGLDNEGSNTNENFESGNGANNLNTSVANQSESGINDSENESSSSNESIFDLSGFWYTPTAPLSYMINQKEDSISWLIVNTDVNGKGVIKDKLIILFLDNNVTVTYNIEVINASNSPTVLFSSHPSYSNVVLFRDCTDFQTFLNELKSNKPNFYILVKAYLNNLSNPTCSNLNL